MNKNTLIIKLPLLVAVAWCMLDAANPVTAQSRHTHSENCLQGDCVPVRSTFGYFETAWRRWPIGQGGTAGVGAGQRLPSDIPPIQTPKPREEADIAPGGRVLNDASPSDVAPSDDQAGTAAPGGMTPRLQPVENPAMLSGPPREFSPLSAPGASAENASEAAIKNMVQRLKRENTGGATLASADVLPQNQPRASELPRAVPELPRAVPEVPRAVPEVLEPSQRASTNPIRKPASPKSRQHRNPLRAAN